MNDFDCVCDQQGGVVMVALLVVAGLTLFAFGQVFWALLAAVGCVWFTLGGN